MLSGDMELHAIYDYHYDNERISIETLMNAFNELAKSLDNIDENISEINLDDIRVFNKNVFEKEKRYNNQYMLSLLLISFVDLGIIEFI